MPVEDGQDRRGEVRLLFIQLKPEFVRGDKWNLQPREKGRENQRQQDVRKTIENFVCEAL